MTQRQLTLGDDVSVSGSLRRGTHCLAVVPNAAFKVGEEYGGLVVASVQVEAAGGPLPASSVWTADRAGRFDVLALQGACAKPGRGDGRILAGDDLSDLAGLQVLDSVPGPSRAWLGLLALLMTAGAVLLRDRPRRASGER